MDVPVANPLARPAAEIVAVEAVPDAQVTRLVRFSVELSENMPVAVNCSVSPFGRLGLAGVTTIDTRVTLLTVSTVWPVTLPDVALIEDVPAASPLARPAEVMVATEVVADAQVTMLVRSSVELSENVPVAVNCSGIPMLMFGLAGVTAIDARPPD